MSHMLTIRISAWKTRLEFDHEVGCLSSLKEKGVVEISKQRVLYGTKAFKIKNPNSNVSCKIMPKIVLMVNGSQLPAL